MIYVDSTKFNPVALIVPNLCAIQKYASANRLNVPQDYNDASTSKEFTDLVYNNCIKEAKSNGLIGSSLLSSIYLCSDEWTVENGLLTPAQKLKRRDITQLYKEQLDELLK